MIVVPEGKEEVSPSSSVCPCSMLSDLLWVLENEVLTSWRSRNTTTQNRKGRICQHPTVP